VSELTPDDPEYWTPHPFFAGVTAAAAEHGLRIVHHPIGPLDDEQHTPVAAILEMQPGYVLPRHAHDCERWEVVLSGSMEIDGRQVGPGTVLRAGAREMYGPHIAGPDGCTTVEVFAALRGVGRIILEDQPGAEPVSYRDGPVAG